MNSVTGFFLANPILNPATLIFMAFVLGWKFIVLRIVLGLIAVVGIATIVGKTSKEKTVDAPNDPVFDPTKESTEALWSRWLKAVGRLVLETIPAYVMIVFLLGVFQGVLLPVINNNLSAGIVAIIFFAVVGTLFVIPTAGEVPILQTLLGLGLTGGPAATLLLTLPAVSVVSLALVKSAYTWKNILVIFLGVVVVGIIAGLIGAFFL